jgi:hypothetical protein
MVIEVGCLRYWKFRVTESRPRVAAAMTDRFVLTAAGWSTNVESERRRPERRRSQFDPLPTLLVN